MAWSKYRLANVEDWSASIKKWRKFFNKILLVVKIVDFFNQIWGQMVLIDPLGISMFQN